MTLLIRSAMLFALLAPGAAAAQANPDPLRLADSLGKEIDAAWLAGDRVRLDGAHRMLDRATVLFPKDALLYHYKGYADYRLLQTGSLSEATQAALITEGLAALDQAARLTPIAETSILRQSLLSQTIKDAGSAMAVAPQIEQALADAMRLGKDNPRVWLVQGIGTFFTPPMWGGGAENALGQLSKAETYFKSDHPARGMPAWGRAEVYAWIGIVHQKLGHIDASRTAYQEALRIEPGFGWVKGVLLPGLDKGIQPFPGNP